MEPLLPLMPDGSPIEEGRATPSVPAPVAHPAKKREEISPNRILYPLPKAQTSERPDKGNGSWVGTKKSGLAPDASFEPK